MRQLLSDLTGIHKNGEAVSKAILRFGLRHLGASVRTIISVCTAFGILMAAGVRFGASRAQDEAHVAALETMSAAAKATADKVERDLQAHYKDGEPLRAQLAGLVAYTRPAIEQVQADTRQIRESSEAQHRLLIEILSQMKRAQAQPPAVPGGNIGESEISIWPCRIEAMP